MPKIVVRKAKPLSPPNRDKISIELDIRKDLDNNLIIGDSIYFDIFVDLRKTEIVTYPKSTSIDTEISYQAQKQFFDFLIKQGIIKRETLEGSDQFNSLRGEYFSKVGDTEESSLKFVLLKISNYVDLHKDDEKEMVNVIKNKISDMINKAQTNPEEFDYEEVAKKTGKERPYFGGAYSPMVDFYTYYY